MKKNIFLTTLFVVSCFISAMAQKPVVYVEYFSYKTGIGEAMAEQVRNSVISGINDTKRVELIDVASVPSLKVESERRQQEALMSDETARVGLMKQAGATHILQGFVSQVSITKNRTEGANAHDYYSAMVNYSLKVIDAATGKLVASSEVSLGKGLADLSTGSTPEEAVTSTLKANRKRIQDFMDENFKLKAIVLAEEFTVKDNEMETCVVTLGTDHGVAKGQEIDVFVIRMIAGRESQKQIGTLKVTEVLAGDLSQCKVTKGGDEMKTAMDEYQKLLSEDPDNARPMTVSTKKKSSFGAKLRRISL